MRDTSQNFTRVGKAPRGSRASAGGLCLQREYEGTRNTSINNTSIKTSGLQTQIIRVSYNMSLQT